MEGRWETLAFQRDILDVIGNDDVRIIDWLKCARIGYTKILLCAAAYFVAHKKRSGALYQPTESDAAEFSKSEVDPVIRDVAELRACFKGDPEKRGRTNTQELKQFAGAMWYIRGGASPRAYRRLTIDWVFYDELEGFEHDIGEEGDPVNLGDARITNSPFPKSVRGSTPRLKHDSLIYGEFDRARITFRYHIVCPACELAQVMVFAQLRWERDKPQTAHYVCQACDEHWQYRDLPQLLDGGFWGSDDGHTIREGVLYDPDGLVIDWPRHIGFHIWAAYSPFFTWAELIEEWLEAVAAQRTGDVRKLKTFTNTRLAEAWEDRGEQVEHSTLYARREAYTRPPAGVLMITAQVDVQANRLELEVVGWGRAEESWGLEYRVIYGDPEAPEVWEELELVLAQHFTTEDGRTLAIAGVALDTGYLPDHVYQFSRRTAHPRVFCLKGEKGTDRPMVSAPHQRRAGRSRAPVDLFLFGADVCKSIVYKRLVLDRPGPGYLHFPDTYDEDYFRSLTAEKKLVKHRRGFEVTEWVKVRPRNEALDIRSMGVALLAIMRPVWDALDPNGTPAPDAADQPEAPFIPHAHHQRPTQRPRRYGDRWRR